MRRFLSAVLAAVLAAVLVAGSSASFGSGTAIAAPNTIDIAAPTTQDTMAAQAVPNSMDIWFTLDTDAVGPLGGVSVSGGFFCQGSAPAAVRLEITLVQNNDAHGFAEGTGVCQGSRTWAATVRPTLPTSPFVPNEIVEAHVTMAIDGDVAQHVSAEALLIKDKLSIKPDPTVTGNPDGTITVSGTYSCDASYDPAIHLAINTTEERADGSAVGGSVLLTLACPSATTQSWAATIPATSSTGSTTRIAGFGNRPKYLTYAGSTWHDDLRSQIILHEYWEQSPAASQ